MLFSLVSLVFLLAAGGEAKPCVKRGNGTTSGQITSNAPQLAVGKCPAGFLNVVFNTDAPKNSGWVNRVWDSLSSNHVSNWIGFSLAPLSQNPHYNTDAGPARFSGPFDAAQIPICMDPSDIAAATTKVTSPSPPAYLELFNEPDFSYGGLTPLTPAQDAAKGLAPLINTQTSTQWISPGPAFTDSSYLTDFAKACNGCMDKIHIISAHVYSVNPQGAIDQIKGLHNTWPDKRIWVTELAPASGGGQGCTYDEAGMIKWMQTVVPQVAALSYVDKIFWNHGSYVSLSFPSPFPPPPCSPTPSFPPSRSNQLNPSKSQANSPRPHNSLS